MSELNYLRNFAASSRRTGFNVPLFRLDGNSGEYQKDQQTAPQPDERPDSRQ